MYERAIRSVKSRTNSSRSAAVRSAQWRPSARRGTMALMNRGLANGGAVVVVDLGGTWVRVVASGPGRRAFRAPTPGVAGLPAVLNRLWRRWRLSRRDVAALGVASRGIWTSA